MTSKNLVGAKLYISLAVIFGFIFGVFMGGLVGTVADEVPDRMSSYDHVSEEEIMLVGNDMYVSFDDKDIKILISLSKNARASLLEIAKEVRISAELTSYRIKQLQKRGIIQGYRVMIDVEKLGYHFYKAEIRLSNYKKIKQIMQFCHQHPNIYQVDKTIGGETLEIEFHVKKLQGMLDIIAEIEGIFQNTIESFDYITVLSEEKMVYMPKISVPLSK